MSPLKHLVVVAALLTKPVHAAPEVLYDKDHWQVYFSEEMASMEQGCILRTVQEQGDFLFYRTQGRFGEEFDGYLTRLSDPPMEEMEETSVLIQVDGNARWEIQVRRGRYALDLWNMPIAILYEMADGETLTVDIDMDGYPDDKFSLAEAGPALQVLADCTFRRE